MIQGLFSIAFLLYSVGFSAAQSAGCIQLDEYNFDKIISKFDATLVKFDIAYPYGDKENAYSDLAKSAKTSQEVLIASVGVKDYGDKDNTELAKKYGITKDDFPVVLLFLKNKPDPISFPKESAFTTDSLRRFVKEKSGFHLSLEGCISELDKIAVDFMKAKGDKRKSLLKTVEGKTYTEKSKIEALKVYILIMQKVLQKDNGFVDSEIKRVSKLLEGKISEEKKNELNLRLNILQAFELDARKTDEL